MQYLNKQIRSRFVLALVLSVALPAGILMTIFGAIKGLWFLLAIGIIGIVAGFYGCPIAWVSFGGLRSQKGILRSITEDGIYSIADLASTYGMDEKKTNETVKQLIAKSYLTGFKLVDGRLQKTQKDSYYQCPYCGTRLEEYSLKCPNCSAPLEKKTFDNR